ncbi:Phage Gp37Gp68, partial [mine drainage metagenome]
MSLKLLASFDLSRNPQTSKRCDAVAETTAIQWTDSTFNPWIGCAKVSPGCDHCYAEVSAPARALDIAWGPHAPRRRT